MATHWSHLAEAAVLFVMLVGFMRASAGRLSARVAIAPIVFLVTRTAVLVSWVIATPAVFAMLVFSARSNGKDPFAALPLLVGVSIFGGLGVTALVVGPAFMLWRSRATPPELAFEPGERVVEDVVGNHFLGGESRGGRLLLTDRRIAFRPNRFNIQLTTWSAPFHAIQAVDTSGARMVVLRMNDGREEWLVAMRPRDLAEKLQQRLARAA